ncbi:hypothetical protein BDZ89DRAFT_242727 [Hymenopellis radicata]|nr:hypothetical protein BDZ89DRAFT_242727 [Hymenopellis radicata]
MVVVQVEALNRIYQDVWQEQCRSMGTCSCSMLQALWQRRRSYGGQSILATVDDFNPKCEREVDSHQFCWEDDVNRPVTVEVGCSKESGFRRRTRTSPRSCSAKGWISSGYPRHGTRWRQACMNPCPRRSHRTGTCLRMTIWLLSRLPAEIKLRLLMHAYDVGANVQIELSRKRVLSRLTEC